MRMTLTNQAQYYKVYGKTIQATAGWTDSLKKAAGRIMFFSPVVLLLFFALLTGLINFLAK